MLVSELKSDDFGADSSEVPGGNEAPVTAITPTPLDSSEVG